MTVLRDYAAALTQPTLGAGEPRYDEVVADDGTLRAPWQAIGTADLDAGGVRRAARDIARLLEDEGVRDATGGPQPGRWRLDPFPLVLDAATWAQLEIGLAQRAELLDVVLADLYGEQRLLAERVVPAAVVFGHPGFVRALARPTAAGHRPLLISGADLGRDHSGRWRVLADRTQSPSGLGYALQNRRVLSRVTPEPYRAAVPHRLAPFYRALRSSLIDAAPGDRADPRVVVLSPGSHSATAFDQAFLASTLGFPLVQGSDLVVRDGRVLMRAPGRAEDRLQRVDVILRRVDAAWSDPLELRGDSRLGVAGLAEAARRGRVTVVNGLGAGVVENPALQPYLGAAAEALLGEPLRLRSVDTWWCGDPAAREQVLDEVAELDVRALDQGGAPIRQGAAGLRRRILEAPHRYVAQRPLPLSQVPVWRPSALGGDAVPGPVTLRAFALRYGSGYRPLLGGLARVGDGPASVSKDVWVLRSEPSSPDQGLGDVLTVTGDRLTTALVPRALEDLYWAGRYAERAEDGLRLLLAALALADDFRARPQSAGHAAMLVFLDAMAAAGAHPAPDPLHPDALFATALLDAATPGTPAHALAALRDALEAVRDQLSPDTWRVFGATDRAADDLRAGDGRQRLAESAGAMLSGVLAFQGVTASMIRDDGWHLIGAGRMLERASQVCTLLGATINRRRGLDTDRAVLDAVLVATESAVTHRRRYRGSVRVRAVLEMLLMDPDNPRSLRACLAELGEHVAAQAASTGSTRPERLIADLAARVDDADPVQLGALDGSARPHLEAFLDTVADGLARVSDAIAELHFAGGPAPRALSPFHSEPAAGAGR